MSKAPATPTVPAAAPTTPTVEAVCFEAEHRYRKSATNDGYTCARCGDHITKDEFNARAYSDKMLLAELQKRLATGGRFGLPLRWHSNCQAFHVPAELWGSGPFALDVLRNFCTFDYESAQRWAIEHQCPIEDDRAPAVCECLVTYQCPTPGCTNAITVSGEFFSNPNPAECYACFMKS
jgi:hypothetical protein